MSFNPLEDKFLPGPLAKKQLSADIALLLVRLIVGWVMILHGAQKLFGVLGGGGMEGFASGLEGMGVPFPVINAWLAALAEFGGGIIVILGSGLLFRLTMIPLIVTMAVAWLVAHGGKFMIQAGGGEYAVVLGVVFIALLISGPGRFTPMGLMKSDK